MTERSRRFQTPLPVDLAVTLAPLGQGPRDPTFRIEGDAIWRASWTPDGAATLRLAHDADEIAATAWGPGADFALAHAPELVGAADALDGFVPSGVVCRIHRDFPGLRIPRARSVFEILVVAILGQKVSGREASESRFRMIRAWGQPAPGPLELTLPPPASELRSRSYFEFHPFGVERRRAETIISVARAAKKLDALPDLPLDMAKKRLLALRGIGPWSTAEVARIGLGDADAVSVGDYNLPNMVSHALAGEPRASDERMLELLEPYRGHRGRVQRLLEAAGIRAPRRGPRRPLRDFRYH